ncbi:MAG: glycosyltransferase [Candidatus Tumulicola sp.]
MRANRRPMPADARNTVAAHLILGPREEPFLGALLDSLTGAATFLIVNDNSPGLSPHAATLAGSAFGKQGRMLVDRAPFAGFGAARNRCLQLHAAHLSGGWVAFVDADEVHDALTIATIASQLGGISRDYDFVDGYTWHFFQSFEYYTSIERRMMFFRFKPEARWESAVHEKLTGIDGRRIALPYVYGHYGHTLEPRRHAEKGRQYSGLGAPGEVLREDQLDDFDVARYFEPEYPRLLRFNGRHPSAGIPTLERLRAQLRPYHDLTERVVRAQPLSVKARNAVRKLNYEIRWRGRALDPRARRLMSS